MNADMVVLQNPAKVDEQPDNKISCSGHPVNLECKQQRKLTHSKKKNNMKKDYPFAVNVPRPYPNTGENKRIIDYIEPLRQADQVKVSDAYAFNLAQYKAYEECSLSPGFKYMFWFKNEADCTMFILKFG